jgi:hypothetical protein
MDSPSTVAANVFLMGILLVGPNRPSKQETISRMTALIAHARLVRRRFFGLKNLAAWRRRRTR